MSSSISLTSAVTSGDEKAVSALLANGADVNETTSGGRTALILAVIFGHTKLIKLLMDAGANPHLRDDLGLNAIEWAQRRGLPDAVAILTNTSQPSTPPKRILIPLQEPAKVAPEAPQPKRDDGESKETVSDVEKSRRWLAGVRQRLDEQAARRRERSEPPHIVEQPPPPPPAVNAASKEAPPVEKPKAEKPKAPEPQLSRSVTPPPRILTPPPTTPAKSTRKRCPQCNAIYNSDLVAYCAHHIVPLVDVDEPIESEPPRWTPPLFWILLIITLTGSIVAGSLITTYVYKTRQAAERLAAEQQTNVQKGIPELSGELVGKAVSLPEAECPVKASEPVAGTVTVRVMVDKKGQVYWARGFGGDWLMRGSATDAAMKSTFAPEKLHGRETEGTITYTFKP
ncbi:MAG TPA: ankyrin repeat domain-containing protein [Pyrinomonadaceae bacterium]